MSQFSDERLRQFVRSTAGYMKIEEATEEAGLVKPDDHLYKDRAQMFDSVIREAREIAWKYLKEED